MSKLDQAEALIRRASILVLVIPVKEGEQLSAGPLTEIAFLEES